MSVDLPAAPQPSRDKILDVAEDLFARGGFDGVGLREVARASGLSKSSLFHHFPTKSHLYVEVVGRVLSRIDARLACVRTPGDPAAPVEARLLHGIDAVVDELAEHAATSRLLLRVLVEDDPEHERVAPEAYAACDAVLLRVVGTLQDLMREGIARGEFRPVSVPDATHTLIGALVFHFASGELGERLAGAPLFSAEAVRRRKRELREFVRRALASDGG